MAGLFKSARDKLNKTGKKWKKQLEKLLGNSNNKEGTITNEKYGEFYNELYNFTKKLNDNYRYIIDKLAYFEKNYKVSDSQMKSIFESLNSMQKEVLKEYYSIEADELGGRLNKKNKQNTQDIHSNKIAQLTTNLDDTCSSIKDTLNNCFALENYIKTADEYKLCLEQEKYFIENGWEVSPRDELAKIEHDIKECNKYEKACKKTVSAVIDNNIGKNYIDRQKRLFDTFKDKIQPKLQEQKDYLSIKVNKAKELNEQLKDNEYTSYKEKLSTISDKLVDNQMLEASDIEVVALIYRNSVFKKLDITLPETVDVYVNNPNNAVNNQANIKSDQINNVLYAHDNQGVIITREEYSETSNVSSPPGEQYTPEQKLLIPLGGGTVFDTSHNLDLMGAIQNWPKSPSTPIGENLDLRGGTQKRMADGIYIDGINQKNITGSRKEMNGTNQNQSLI